MTFREAVKEAYRFGSDRGWVFGFVVRRGDGSYYWGHAESPQTIDPDSAANIVWRCEFAEPVDIGEPTDFEWKDWLDVNATGAD